ncbi:MAG: AmmeMemoRadiSam system protein A [Deltaproteobacteria bacterium]|nr:AmmeMemoRadiSam system protein A [Deltaproteobacteria bacterium]
MDRSADRLSEEERVELLSLARETIRKKITKGRLEPLEPPSGKLARPCGAFVSLHKRGDLRGCIGTFVSSRPLQDTVAEMAISAATRDPRFPPVTEPELAEIDVEISVLSPLREIDDPADIEVGRHGIYISRGLRSGVLLPQVATEYGWDRETFLQHTCLKAGLPPDAWRELGTKIELFEAEVFGEKERGERDG